MGLIAPGQYIAPPAIEALRFGLYSTSLMPEGPARWDLGIEWEPIAGERAELRPSECVNDYTIDIELRAGEETREGIPFLVVGSYECAAQSRPLDEAEERARLHLAAGEERAAEYAIASGVMGNLPTFQGADDLTPSGGAVGIVQAMSLLESGLAKTFGSLGAVHAPRALGPVMADHGQFERVGQHLETGLGTYVALGGGYDLANLGPDGEEPDEGEFWIYATGRPSIRRGEIFTQPDDESFINRETNMVAIMAQRAMLVSWSGPTLAVLVAPFD